MDDIISLKVLLFPANGSVTNLIDTYGYTVVLCIVIFGSWLTVFMILEPKYSPNDVIYILIYVSTFPPSQNCIALYMHSICFCVMYMCIWCTWMCTYMLVHSCVCMGDQGTMLGIFLYHLSLYYLIFWDRVSHWVWAPFPAGLVGRKVLGSAWLYSTGLNYSYMPPCPDFIWLLGFWIQAHKLLNQELSSP